jgi:nitrous oxide reductase
MTGRTRRQFLASTGITLAAALATNPARAQLVNQAVTNPASAQLVNQAVTTRHPSKLGVSPGYIVSGRGEHSSNPYFLPQGKPSTKHTPRPQAVHGKGVIEEDAR